MIARVIDPHPPFGHPLPQGEGVKKCFYSSPRLLGEGLGVRVFRQSRTLNPLHLRNLGPLQEKDPGTPFPTRRGRTAESFFGSPLIQKGAVRKNICHGWGESWRSFTLTATRFGEEGNQRVDWWDTGRVIEIGIVTGLSNFILNTVPAAKRISFPRVNSRPANAPAAGPAMAAPTL